MAQIGCRRGRGRGGASAVSEVLRVGFLNVRGMVAEVKRKEVEEMCKERNLNVLALNETKLKGKGEMVLGNFKGYYSGVSMRVRGREGVALVMKEEFWNCISDVGLVNSRLMWVKIRLGSEKWVFVSVYGPVNGGGGEGECEGFWEGLDECLRNFERGTKLCVLGDFNARVGKRGNTEVLGPFGIDGINENGERMVEMCESRGLIIGNTWFKKKSIHKMTWVSGVNGEGGILDYICVGRDDRSRLLDVNVQRGAAGGISDHYLVVAKLRVLKGGRVRERMGGGDGVEIVRVERLEDDRMAEEYRRKMAEKWEMKRGCMEEGVEDEWRVFKEALLEVARDVCGVKRVGGRKRRRQEFWWNDEVKEIVQKKRERFLCYLRSSGDEKMDEWEDYKDVRREVKRVVARSKKRANDEWCINVANEFRDNSKKFWKEVNGVRKKNIETNKRIKLST